MKAIQERLRTTAQQLLESGQVNLVIGYGPGSEAGRVIPLFISKPEEASRLVWNPLCVNNLAKYLTDYRNHPGKVAVVVKGCDSRAVVRLLQDQQIQREQVVVLGIPCSGLVNPAAAATQLDPAARIVSAGEDGQAFHLETDRGTVNLNREESLLAKCRECENHTPVLADIMLGEGIADEAPADPFKAVKALEELPVAGKSAFWDRQFSRCLRCYACRNVCPACTCRECIFDQAEPCWVAKANNLSENTAFHLIRAFHVAGRCVDCGECDRVCPVDIPLRLLNRKILKDIKDLFHVPTPGTILEELPVLGAFSPADPDEFM
ncbi:dehydrogenase [Desulfofundulus thermobenzoicus]|uniref:Dehydrogenase n=1 Tax=Desulfofundulus thermobenzoicus TaxID=29376 RepID=A0A6N7ITI6_9FIRM|nr:Coenzyme F420 hydrogenase/dehydrogenase, beta subunit C-terminal domain [Desulfofundulus thermobenzoicus]MQL53362.1 dehydrogenase [Desulfofundulus thermobenzoicus]